MQQALPVQYPVKLLSLLLLRGRARRPTVLFLRVLKRLINSTITTQCPNLACSHVGLLVSSVLLVFGKFPISATDIISALEVRTLGKYVERVMRMRR
jgi:hypothetical protein